VHRPSAHTIVPHALLPVQVRVHAPLPVQLRLPQTALPVPPLQVSVQLPPWHVTFPHAPSPVQAAVQLPVVHEMFWHAPEPLHVTSQFFVRHEMPRHAPVVRQSMSHDAALPQLIAPHAPACPQVMLHR
jgi:hypothetical protein